MSSPWRSLVTLCTAAVCATAPCPAAASADQALAAAERELGTSGRINRRFHDLVRDPEAFGLHHEGYLIGIEKANRGKLGLARNPEEDPGVVNLRHAPELHADTRAQLRRVLGDGRRLFVSHLVRYEARREETDPLQPRFLFQAYCREERARRALARWCAELPKPEAGGYLESFAALDALGRDLASRLEEARAAGRPFTHLLVLAMGWNTDQQEAVEGYNRILDGLRTEAPEGSPYRPLAIGVTWPSGWGSLLLVPGSYGNKAKDADEAGAVWLNYLLHRTLPRALPEPGKAPQVIVIGHSFGARLLTRAVFSESLLDPSSAPPSSTTSPALVIALQGAFSANRFLAERKRGREGAPYSSYSELAARFALTWSRKDKANPVANFVSNANQVGGRPGYERARCHQDHFELLRAKPKGASVELEPEVAQGSSASQGRIAMIDATAFVGSHSDIYRPEMSRLLWRLIQEAAPQP